MRSKAEADLILYNGNIATQDPNNPFVSSVAISKNKIIGIGEYDEMISYKTESTRLINLKGKTVIPGLNDSHIHLIRGGLSYNLELRWDFVTSLADALSLLKEQAERTPPPQWVRVVGGWGELQFKEKRMPTLEEINAVSSSTPVFILHLYDRAWLNAAALRAIGYTKETPDFPGGRIERDINGNPTGMIIAEPNALILYATLAKGPKLPLEFQVNSTKHFMRELNRLGITSVVDAGGGFQNYPDDYAVIEDLHRKGEMTVRIAYNLFTQKNGQEKEDFSHWVKECKPGDGDAFYKMNGAGEMLVFSASDFEDFLQPRPIIPERMDQELTDVIRILAAHRWPFRIHATYNETISRDLDVFEKVNQEIPFNGLHWFIDHAETISERNMERVRALGGGIAIQHRMAYQGEYFIDRYGKETAKHTPPIKRMLELGIPVGGGTDATRVASYNPFISLYWMITGKTVGGTSLYSQENLCSRHEALRLYTLGSAWFSNEETIKGKIMPGQLADLAVLSKDFFSIPEEEIKMLESVLTIVDGKIVYASGEYGDLAPPALPVMPDWSPIKYYGASQTILKPPPIKLKTCCLHPYPHKDHILPIWGDSGCSCFVF